MQKLVLILFLIITHSAYAQRDTIKVNITKVPGRIVDTIYNFSSRVDTIALQPIQTDTSKIVKDINPQDLEKSKYEVRLMGSVRVNSYYDFIGMTSTEGFLPYDIPVGQQSIDGLSSVYIGSRQSRIGLEGTANTKVGKIKTYIEVDFASRTSSFWRLRHAFAEWNFLKLGYTWTTFMDNASLPSTVDFEGPNSSLSKRQGLIRYERKINDFNSFGVSIESPQTDYYNPADTLIEGRNIQGNFDIAGRLKKEHSWGHIQLAGVFRRIAYLKYNEIDNLYGWGVLLSSIIKFKPEHNLYLQYSAGEGLANYYVGFIGRGLDAVYDPLSQKMTLKSIHGGFATYTYFMNPMWRFSATVGLSFIKNKDFEPADAFYSSRYIAANAFYRPIETISIGAEITSGQRTNNDLMDGNAARISTIFIFNF